MATRVRLFGPPAIESGGEVLWPPAGKTSALLLHLAYRGDWVGRSELADLFWRDVREATARSNLRSLLSRAAPSRPYAVALEVEPARVRWRVASDVAEFRAAFASGRHAEAFTLGGGELLEGFVVEGATGFDEWLAREREATRRRWRESALEVCRQLEASGEWSRSVDVLERLRETDPYDEDVLRRLLSALAGAGRTRRAREVYERFRAWLADEVGAEPEPATSAAADRAHLAGGFAATGGPSEAPAPAGVGTAERRRASPLPTPATETLGRARERALVAALLREGRARLVTLTGPGGIGKTRLALAVAHDLDEAWQRRGPDAGEHRGVDWAPAVDSARGAAEGLAHEVVFVPCETALGPGDLVAFVADAVGLPLVGPGEPRRQLLDHLAARRVLLVLDNLEQLSGRLGFLDELLATAPGVSVLATSRELLGSPYEHAVDVAGLELPAVDDGLDPASAARVPAVALFASCGRRVRSDFRLTDENVAAVARVCRLVDGMPLAIELAASWLRALTTREIAEEIARGLDILASAVPAEGDRHRSVRAAFDCSWTALAPGERGVLARLSAFAGSFSLAAAASVADATVADIASLVNRSLVARTREGRYRLHPLVRGYAAERLAGRARSEPGDAGSPAERGAAGPADVDAAAEARRAHCAYYSSFLSERLDPLVGGDQRRAVDEIAAEVEDVRAAWARALETADLAALGAMAPALSVFFTFGSRFQELHAAFSAGARRSRDVPSSGSGPLLAFLLTQVGWSAMRLGRYQESEAALLEALSLVSEAALGPRFPAGDPRLPLSLMASTRGEHDVASRYGEAALGAGREHGNALNERVAHYALARASLGRDDLEGAEEHVLRALASCERAGDRWFTADCLVELGDVALAAGRPEAADRHYEDALHVCREFGNGCGVAEAMNRRAALALRRGQREQARGLFLESLAVGQAVGDGREIARAECGLGEVLSAEGEARDAAAHFRRALRHAAKLRSWPLVRRIADGAAAVTPEGLGPERWGRLDPGPPRPTELPRLVDELELALARALLS